MTLGPYQPNHIYPGDSRDLSRDLPANCIDLIFTDPPYARPYLPLYSWLAQEALRVLKPGGFLAVMTGGYHLAEVFHRLSIDDLHWYFKIEVFNRQQAPVMFPRRIVTRTKPILLWTKGPGVIQIWNMTDVYQGQGKDKKYHPWGQDVGSARYCIEYILGSGRGGLVWDPFTGGGATLEACHHLRVDYLGFELDPTVAETAQTRMRQLAAEACK